MIFSALMLKLEGNAIKKKKSMACRMHSPQSIISIFFKLKKNCKVKINICFIVKFI